MRLPFRRRSSPEPDGQLDAAPTTPGTELEAVGTTVTTRSIGWGRLLQGNRTIWVIAAVAIIALVAGLVVGRFVVSPGQAAADAEPPKPGLITVPVERKVLANDITIRGDANYADSVELTVETGDIGGRAIVTGQVPAVGATFVPGSIALEVTGRPVIVLPGDLPVYRTLRVGVSGPDVVQLKQALGALGIAAGDPASSLFDADTAAGVAALYALVGYEQPSSPDGSSDAVRSANDGVRAAEDGLAAAQHALAVAQGGASGVERLEQDQAVARAERELAAAQAGGDAMEIANAQDALDLARARRAALNAPRDTSLEAAAVASASAQVDAAREMLNEAYTGTLAFLPASEVQYLPGLPRRVDEVSVQRGSTIQGAVMRVSGATLVIEGSASENDAKLLAKGDRAIIAMPDGSEQGATVTEVAPAKAAKDGKASDSGRFTVLLEPDTLTAEQLAALQGNNVRVSIPVSSTDGEVLAVPIAALTAGPGGESRVEVAAGEGEKTVLVEVTTGLAAGGFVEVSAVEGKLTEDDLVVVGR